MTIDTREVVEWAEKEKALFKAMDYTEFNDGLIAGLDMTLAFIQLYEKHLGENIAKDAGEI